MLPPVLKLRSEATLVAHALKFLRATVDKVGRRFASYFHQSKGESSISGTGSYIYAASSRDIFSSVVKVFSGEIKTCCLNIWLNLPFLGGGSSVTDWDLSCDVV